MFFLISYVGIVGSKLETWKQGQTTDFSTRKGTNHGRIKWQGVVDLEQLHDFF